MNIMEVVKNQDLLYLNKKVPKTCADCSFCRKNESGTDYYTYECTLGNDSIINDIYKKPEWCYIAPVSLKEVLEAIQKDEI